MADIQKNLQIVSTTFQQVLSEFSKSKIIEKFQKEFNEIINILEKAAKSQRQLLSRCRELSASLSMKEELFAKHQQKEIEKENAIDEIRQDLSKACKCIENAERREIKYKESIVALEAKILNLEKEIEVPVVEKDNTFEAEAEREKMLLNSRIIQLEADLHAKEESELQIRSQLIEAMSRVQQLHDDIDGLGSKLKKELGRSQRVSKDRLLTQSDIRVKENKIHDLENSIGELRKAYDLMETRLNAYKLKTFNHQSKLSALQSLYCKAQDQANNQMQFLNNLTMEKDRFSLLVQKKDEDLKNLNGKLIEGINSKESLIQKVSTLQHQKQDAEKMSEMLKSKLLISEKAIQKMIIKQSQHDSKVSNLIREKELLANNIIKLEGLIEKYMKEYKVSENERIAAQRELKESHHHVEMQNKLIVGFEAMREQFLSDIADLTKKIETLNDEVCSHEDKEAALESKIMKLSAKLTEQMDISHAAVIDRKMYCQHYKESKENEHQLNHKVDILNNHINELKELLSDKTEQGEDWKKKWEVIEQQNKKLVGKLTNEQGEMETAKKEQKHLHERIHQHIRTISIKEKELDIFKTKVLHLTEDSMIARSQLAGKKEELIYIQEKLRLSQLEIKKEQELYANLENGMKLLKLEILRLTGEKQSLICKVNDLEKVKQSFTYAQQELVKERFRTSALEREIQQPINIHRWRLLKGTDPEKYKLIENYHVLQKQLMNKTVETEQKSLKLSNMGKLVEQLKNIVAKQKSVQSKCSVDDNKKEIQAKNDRIKVLSAEINMYETYMTSYQDEILHLKDELRSLKVSRFFRRKKDVVPI